MSNYNIKKIKDKFFKDLPKYIFKTLTFITIFIL